MVTVQTVLQLCHTRQQQFPDQHWRKHLQAVAKYPGVSSLCVSQTAVLLNQLHYRGVHTNVIFAQGLKELENRHRASLKDITDKPDTAWPPRGTLGNGTAPARKER